RTFADWNETRPGFLEVDLVAHCGERTKGEYLHTLTSVDIDTRWCELAVLPNRSQQAVGEAVDVLRKALPFPLLGIDSDNDSAFLNANLSRYCEAQKITFTRCRPYKKNDQAYVEQKNWSAVRKLVGYGRYESPEALAILKAIYADWRLFLNFFQPVRKLVSKEQVGSKVRKKYDRAQTPYPRVLASPWVREEDKAKLRELWSSAQNGEKLRAVKEASWVTNIVRQPHGLQ
ncbi:MAG: transposase family protein, partial [Candidatus Bipolaricaulota bacterium]|nr:transposase family protein [Candidatus Bipolaricaulota bacterium]MDW8127550.1 transposase family protein [Candidatus Bipolaricaulota bacterium]